MSQAVKAGTERSPPLLRSALERSLGLVAALSLPTRTRNGSRRGFSLRPHARIPRQTKSPPSAVLRSRFGPLIFVSRVLTSLAWPLQTAAEGVSWRLAEGPGNGKDRKPWTRQNEQSCGRIPAVQIAATRLTDAATVGSTSTPATEANRSAAHDAQFADQTSAAAAAVTVRDAPRHDVLRARRLEGFWRHPKGSRSTRGSKPLKEPVPVSALTSHDR